MSKNLTIAGSILALGVLFIIGCQKQTRDQFDEGTDQLAAKNGRHHDNDKSRCRVTLFDFYDGIADVHQYDTYTYKNGRVDEWAVWFGGVFKMEYDHHGKLKKSRYYLDNALVYTIHFFYNNDRVVKEIWYVGDTKEIDDEVIYTFDKKGQIIRMESFVGDYYCDNTYAANGDLTSWEFYLGGLPLVSGHYTYYNRYKSPLAEGTPGVDYNFSYGNSTFGRSKWWYSSEKMVYYDENGNESVYYDQDPKQTKWQTGDNKYPELVSYFSPLSSSNHSVGFGYENCERGNNGHNGHHKSSEMARKNTVASTAAMSGSIRSILSGPKNKLKERANEFRMQMKKRSKN